MDKVTGHLDKINFNDNPNYPIVEDTLETYLGFIKNWDQETLDHVKEIKALGLDEHKNVLFEITVKVSAKNLQEDMEEALRIAKKHHAKMVVFGLNQPNKQVYPNLKEKTLARKILSFAKNLEMPIKDQLVVSGSSFYSFAENGLI